MNFSLSRVVLGCGRLGRWRSGVLCATRVRLAGMDLQAGAGGGRADQADDRLQRHQRLAAPVHRDEGERAVLDSVPFRAAGREVADADLKTAVVGEFLQLDLPQLRAVAVGAAAVGGDLKRGALG